MKNAPDLAKIAKVAKQINDNKALKAVIKEAIKQVQKSL